MTLHFTSRTGYDRRVSVEEELTILIAQDGTALISLPDAYANESLLSAEQTSVAIHDIAEGRV